MNIFLCLPNSIERRFNFDKLNSKYINYTYFDGIDGKKLHKKYENIVKKDAINYTAGAVGCAMSHLGLWNKCIELDKPIIIMEDDVFVSKDFNKHVTNIMNMVSKDWDIILLSYNCDTLLSYSISNFEYTKCIFDNKKFTDNDIAVFQQSILYPTVAKLRHAFGTSAYIISPKGAKLLKDKCFPMDNRNLNLKLKKMKSSSIDCMMNYYYNDINAYVCPIPFIMSKHLHINYNSTI